MTRDEIVRDQQRRIGRSLGECMAEKGYAHTTIGDIIARAHVSRATFYQLYDDKQSCFLDVYARARSRLLRKISAPSAASDAPRDRLAEVVRGYLDIMTEDPVTARVFLVEIYAAGPSAVQERLKLQQGTADGLAAVFGLTTEAERFACRAVVAVVANTITQELVLGSVESAQALYEPLVALASKMLEPGSTAS